MYFMHVQGTRSANEVVIMTVHDIGCDREYITTLVSMQPVQIRGVHHIELLQQVFFTPFSFFTKCS